MEPTTPKTDSSRQSVRAGNVKIVIPNIEPPLNDFQLNILDSELANQKWGVQATIQDVEKLLTEKLAGEYSKTLYDNIKKDIEEGKFVLNYDFTAQYDLLNQRFQNCALKDESYTKTEIENRYISKDDVTDSAGVSNGTIQGKGNIPRITNLGYLNIPYLNAAAAKVMTTPTIDLSHQTSHIVYRNNDGFLKFADPSTFYNNYLKPHMATYMVDYYTKNEADKKFVDKNNETFTNKPVSNKIPMTYNFTINNSEYKSIAMTTLPYTVFETSFNVPNLLSIGPDKFNNIKDFLVRTVSNEIVSLNAVNFKTVVGVPDNFATTTDVSNVSAAVLDNRNKILTLDKDTYKKSELYTKEQTDILVNATSNDLNTKLNTKANSSQLSNYYTKTEINSSQSAQDTKINNLTSNMGKVVLKGTRTTTGAWVIPNLVVSKPLIICAKMVHASSDGNVSYRITAGSNSGNSPRASSFIIGGGTPKTPSSFIIIPTAASVTISIDAISLAGSVELSAWQ